MRWIFISPHLDDAVLSAGGLIYELARSGARVETWTLTCGFPPEGEVSPLAQILHFQWGFSSAEETVRLRRAEDVRAAQAVGATAVHFDFLDCIYRRGRDGEWLYGDVFLPLHAEDAGLPAQMTAALAARLQPEDQVACPLAIGGHVDHVTVRRAVEGLVLSEVEGLGRPLVYFADIPYLLDHPGELEPSTMQMQAEVKEVSSAGLAAWQDGIAAYESQIPMLFESPEKMREAMAVYGQRGVRLWKVNIQNLS
jgi:LmbE family N-acetylglucosaminyl deacetylase